MTQKEFWLKLFNENDTALASAIILVNRFVNNQTEAWYKDIYILNKGKYAKALVVNVDGEKAVKMYGNVYVTKYDETRKAWLVNTKYGLYRF